MPPLPWGPGPPGEEDVGLIFEVEAQQGRVVFLGTIFLVTITAMRARLGGQEGAGPLSSQLGQPLGQLTEVGGV